MEEGEKEEGADRTDDGDGAEAGSSWSEVVGPRGQEDWSQGSVAERQSGRAGTVENSEDSRLEAAVSWSLDVVGLTVVGLAVRSLDLGLPSAGVKVERRIQDHGRNELPVLNSRESLEGVGSTVTDVVTDGDDVAGRIEGETQDVGVIEADWWDATKRQ